MIMSIASVFLVYAVLETVVAAECGTSPQCRTFASIYGNGEQLCNSIFGSAFVYEADEDKAFAMWWDYGDNPNTEIAESMPGLAHLTNESKETCHLAGDVTGHHDSPQYNQSLKECHPWSKGPACCAPSTVMSASQMNDMYGAEWAWDRCGPLSAACERFFVEEACFYECEPTVGFYRRYPVSSNVSAQRNSTKYIKECDEWLPGYNPEVCAQAMNHWEVYKMPIKASYCDSWYSACADDLFCGDGDFYSCAAKYRECDDNEKLELERKLNETEAEKEKLEQQLNETKENVTSTGSNGDDGSDDSDGIDTGLIVGVSVAAAIALIAIVFVVLMVMREKGGHPIFTPLENSGNNNELVGSIDG